MADIVRVTQLGIEILTEPEAQVARVTQLGVEVLSEPGAKNVRATQLGVEVLMPNTIPGIIRATQLGVEILSKIPELSLHFGIHQITINITNP